MSLPPKVGAASRTLAARVLLVEQDAVHLRLLRTVLEPLKVEISTAVDAQEAWRRMQGTVPDLVVVDGGLPGVSGLELLRGMRSDRRLAQVPVVLQATSGASRERRDALEAGAAYCVAKTLDGQLLLSVVRATLRTVGLEPSTPTRSPLTRLREGTFEFQTLDDAQQLAIELGQLCPNADCTALGLIELMNNAVEHGNLEISYQEKARLCRDGEWSAEIARRLERPEYRDRIGSVSVRRLEQAVVFRVQDEGPGFSWNTFMAFDPERAQDPNGRGIALARSLAFSNLRYEGRGNIVTAEVPLEID